MKRKTLAMLMVLLAVALPLTALAQTMYINTSNGGSVNLRSGPSADEDILVSVPYGEAVDVIDMLFGSSWVNVNYNGYYGYISSRYLSDYPPPAPGPLPTFVPAPTARPNPTKQPSGGGSSLEKTLSQMFAGFKTASYQAVVVPSTPSNYVNLRWAPSKSAPIRAQYWAGNTLQVLGDNGSWVEVYDTATNAHGYMMSTFVKPTGFGADSGS